MHGIPEGLFVAINSLNLVLIIFSHDLWSGMKKKFLPG